MNKESVRGIFFRRMNTFISREKTKMLTEREQEILKHILNEGEKREKNRLYRYFLYILMIVTLLIGIFALLMGLTFKDRAMLTLGIFTGSIGIAGIIKLPIEKIFYNAIKKILPSSEIFSINFNNSSEKILAVTIGLPLIIGGLIVCFRFELIGLKVLFLKKTIIYIIYKIIGFTVAGIGFLMIVVPSLIKR